MKHRDKVYLAVAATISIGFTMHLFHTADLLPTQIIGLCALGAGLVLWCMTSPKHPTNPALLLPPYLITAALLMLHILEEYLFDFGNMIAGVTSGIWTTEQFLWTIGFAFPIVWMGGAYAIARSNQLVGLYRALSSWACCWASLRTC